ncbi:MAG TPA: hypothetical protein VKI17_09035 [Gemmataceae bacterium]|nr:hypothetical protein [Gemmataceae bacterium]
MGMDKWTLDPDAVQEKLAKAYGPRSPDSETEVVEAQQPDVTYKSSGVVLKIEPNRKAEFKAKLDDLTASLSVDI